MEEEMNKFYSLPPRLPDAVKCSPSDWLRVMDLVNPKPKANQILPNAWIEVIIDPDMPRGIVQLRYKRWK